MNRKKARITRNPVAKFSTQFNRAKVFKDRTKYRRKNKHKGQEPFACSLIPDCMQKVFFIVLGLFFCGKKPSFCYA